MGKITKLKKELKEIAILEDEEKFLLAYEALAERADQVYMEMLKEWDEIELSLFRMEMRYDKIRFQCG